MKPTEHQSPLDKELIAHMRESLLEHEESYPLGAWEKFNAPEKKTRPAFWIPILRVAAVLLIAGFISFLLWDKNTKDEPIAKANVDSAKPEAQVQTKADTPIRKTIIAKEPTESFGLPQFNQPVEGHSPNHPKQNQSVIAAIETRTVSKQIEEVDQQLKIANNKHTYTLQQPAKVEVESLIIKPIQEVASTNKVTNPSTNIIDFLDSETKNNQSQKSKDVADNKKSKFTIGLVVAPSFGNVKRLNMGYGVSVDYSLSDKFSLNSGLAYNQMAAAKGAQNELVFDNVSTSSAIAKAETTKNLESIEERVTGIDIPLEVKYHVNKSFYANVGVSAFAVINQKQSNTYLERRLVQQYTTANSFSSTLVSERVTQQETPIQNYRYLGFYNLSFGYQKKISKNNSFAIEPFLKLPMREVKMENLRLVGTGVKLKFDF